jgi:hypothetical protein
MKTPLHQSWKADPVAMPIYTLLSGERALFYWRIRSQNFANE